MKKLFKGKFGTILIILVTLVLAGIAVFTAVRLYNLRQQPVAPNVPSSFPKAEDDTGAGDATPTTSNCHRGFEVLVATPIPLSCNKSCGIVADISTECGSGLSCVDVNTDPNTVVLKCRNLECKGKIDCVCPTDSPATTSPAPSGAPNSCGGTCGSDINCASDLFCYNGYCRNPSCSGETDCACSGTGSSTSTPTEPTLPQSGTNWPTFVGTIIGVMVIFGSILLAL